MPRVQRGQGVIEVSVPIRIARAAAEASGSDAEDDEACFICSHEFCPNDECHLTATQLRCCTQSLCCGCAVKVSKRCLCSDECDAVVSFCPFCREVRPVGALDIFLGTRPGCKSCKSCAVAVGADAAPTPPATEAAVET